jgi:hypothetical protein
MCRLVCEELLVKTSKDRYRTNFAAFDATDQREIAAWIRSQGANAADVITKSLPTLRDAWRISTRYGVNGSEATSPVKRCGSF